MTEFDLIQNPIMFIITMLNNYVFGDMRITGIFILIVGLVFCLANGFDMTLIAITLSPLIISLIAGTFLPVISWFWLIYVASILWIVFIGVIANIFINR